VLNAFVSSHNSVSNAHPTNCQKAKVVEIKERLSAAQELEGFDKGEGVNIIFEAKVLQGENKGEVITSVQSWDPNSIVPLKEVSVGDKVLLVENVISSSSYKYVFADYIRFDTLILFIGGFLVMLVLFGQSKGIKTIISLVLTCISIFMVFIPSVLGGMNIYYWSVGVCVYIIIMTLVVAGGYNKKSLCSGIGCIGGVALCGVLIKLADRMLMLSGLGSDDAAFLAEISIDKPIDLNGVIFAAIIIGAVGAIMDISMSISSSLFEIKEKSPYITKKELITSGLSIGKDIMGTMANTLILAYIGSSLAMTLLMVAYNESFLLLFNKEALIVEILQAVIGSIGILLTMPLTSFVCAAVYQNKKQPVFDDNNSSN
ncbi:MAG: YibE/F family protein, partial [Oscillospiraceae bacterium]